MWDLNKTPRVASMDSEFAKSLVGYLIDGSRRRKGKFPGSCPKMVSQWKSSHNNISHPFEGEISEVGKYIYGHHVTKESFINSIKKGCAVCSDFLLMHVGTSEKDISQIERETGFFSVFTLNDWDLEHTDKLGRSMRVWFKNQAKNTSIIPLGYQKYQPVVNLEISPSTGDSATWKIIDKWLTDCVLNHEHCKNSDSATRYLPTRLLEIDDRSFRLVLGSECDSNEHYMTLSHCWGKKPLVESQARLLKPTFDILRQHQPISKLPKTFRDAMDIVSRLGVRYLWIDRLCIFQDSTEDWGAEAASMQDVYKNSYLTISALSATDNEGGCLFERDPEKVAPSAVSMRKSPDQEPATFGFESEMKFGWFRMFEGQPITKRAWILQERLLSSRVLHFGSKQVFWECCERNACETNPDTIPVYYFLEHDRGDHGSQEEWGEKKEHPHLWKQLIDAYEREYLSDPYEQLFADWQAVLRVYTRCQLTVPSDKLVALSGIANDMQRRLKDFKHDSTKYLAGLWEAKLREGLIWYMVVPGHRRRPPETYRAPSWSWASLDGKIDFEPVWSRSRSSTPLITEIYGETTLVGTSETGEVSGGSVTLRAPMMHIKINSHATARIGPCRVSAFTHPMTQESWKFEEEHADSSTEHITSEALFLLDSYEEVPEEMVGVPLIMRAGSPLWVLAVVPVEGKEVKYRRVGMVQEHTSQTLAHGGPSNEEFKEFIGKLPITQMTIV